MGRGFESLKTHQYAPLAQLVEHLTLNQVARGSSPRWRTMQITGCGADGSARG
ncbi:hypothetical protein CLOSBL3_20369 [Clostridiaceae bacterium BL-3]|nr:hypothetical protein CLOSBL3_20369 [Clostridiaceae bacterium BL-3]